MMKRLYFLSAIVLLVSGMTSVLNAQQARLYVLPDSVAIGDIITYTIVFPSETEYQSLVLPDSAAFGSDVEIIGRRQFRTSAQSDSIEYQLQFFGTTDLQIQGITVEMVRESGRERLDVPPVLLPFKTTLVEEEPELRPMKDIYFFAINWLPYVLLLLALILAGWVIIRYLRRYMTQPSKQREEEVPPQFINPFDLLEQRLLSLRSDSSLIERDFKPFYTNLGDAIRYYLESVHGVPALESTTRELTRDMQKENIDKDLIKQTTLILRQADFVKFAKFEPTAEQAIDSVREAERFLQTARMTDFNKVRQMQADFDRARAEEEEAKRKARRAKEKKDGDDNSADENTSIEEAKS